jgi:hypothetical protein
MLYYWEGSELRAARVRTSPDFAILSRETVFTDSSYAPSCCFSNYDLHPDGKRFVMARRGGKQEEAGFVVVVNWFEELKARMGSAKK